MNDIVSSVSMICGETVEFTASPLQATGNLELLNEPPFRTTGETLKDVLESVQAFPRSEA